jgi:hypothetical protein
MKLLQDKSRTTVGAHSANNPFAPHAPSVSIVVIFDTPSHLAEARGLLNRLIGTCDPGVTLHADEWSINDLDNVRFRQEALELARHCDLFVIASDTMSDSILGFTADWLTRPRDGSAALVLVAFSTRCVADAEFFGVRQIARQRRVDYFSTIIDEAPVRRNSGAFTFIESPTEPSPINE